MGDSKRQILIPLPFSLCNTGHLMNHGCDMGRDRKIQCVEIVRHDQSGTDRSAGTGRHIAGKISLIFFSKKMFDLRNSGPAGQFSIKHINIIADSVLKCAGGHPAKILCNTEIAHKKINKRFIFLKKRAVTTNSAVKSESLSKNSARFIHIVENPISIVVTYRRHKSHQIFETCKRFLTVTQKHLILEKIDIPMYIASNFSVEALLNLIMTGDCL